MIKVIYHKVDFDGIVSAAVVSKFTEGEKEFIPWNYDMEGEPDVVPGDELYVVDFSMEDFSIMEKWNRECRLTWIDHHASAIRKYEEYLENGGKPINGIRQESDTLAACALAWKWFTDQPMPRFVDYVSSYDVWNHYSPDVVLLQDGLSLLGEHERMPWSDTVSRLVDGDDVLLEKTIENGRVVSLFREGQNRSVCKAQAFSVSFEGLEFLAANTKGSSRVFDSIWDSSKYDAMMLFWMDSSMRWHFSLYSPKEKEYDLSKIAVRYGGGGHPHACGFTASELPPALRSIRLC